MLFCTCLAGIPGCWFSFSWSRLRSTLHLGKSTAKQTFQDLLNQAVASNNPSLEGDAVLGFIRFGTAAGDLPESGQRVEELEAFFTHVTHAR